MDIPPAPAWTCVGSHPLGRFYRALGHRVALCAGALWIDVGRFSMTSVPCGEFVDPTRAEVEELLRGTGRAAAQFPIRRETGGHARRYVMQDPAYGPGHQQRQFRQHVRKGATSCVVREVGWAELARSGWPVVEDAHARQGRSSALGESQWEEVCAAGSAGAGLGVTGCFVGETLAAFVIHWTVGRRRHGLVLHRWSRFDPQRVSHCLVDGFTTSAMGRDALDMVVLGRQMIPPDQRDRMTGVMKEHAGYKLEPIRVGAVLHPSWGRFLGAGAMRGVLEGTRRLLGGRVPMLDNVDVLHASTVTRLRDDPVAGARVQPPVPR